LRRGADDSDSIPWIPLNGILLFSAADGVHGRELWGVRLQD
jgi:hypothetical protein